MVGSNLLCINLAISKIGADLHYFRAIFGDFQLAFAPFRCFSALICIISAQFALISPTEYISYYGQGSTVLTALLSEQCENCLCQFLLNTRIYNIAQINCLSKLVQLK